MTITNVFHDKWGLNRVRFPPVRYHFSNKVSAKTYCSKGDVPYLYEGKTRQREREFAKLVRSGWSILGTSSYEVWSFLEKWLNSE